MFLLIHPNLGDGFFILIYQASYLVIIESLSNAALLPIPHLVLMGLILWTKIGHFTLFGLCFSFKHINNTDFYQFYLFRLSKPFLF